MKTLHNLLIGTTLFLSSAALAQTDTTRKDTRGDRNTQVTTTSRTNVPKNQRTQNVQSPYKPDPNDPNDKPDVLLDVPNLSVDEITLDVQNLKANVALDAR